MDWIRTKQGGLSTIWEKSVLLENHAPGIGGYFNKVCTNLLDEISGKGAYGTILNASGYIYGMTFNLAQYYDKIEKNNKETNKNIEKIQKMQSIIEHNFDVFEKMQGEIF